MLEEDDLIEAEAEDYGVIWWDDFEATGKKARDEKNAAALQDRLTRLYDYCVTDVEAERSAETLLYPLSPDEEEVYRLDQRINDRGIAIDVETVKNAINLIERSSVELDKQLAVVTKGAVTAASQRERIVKWLATQGYVFPTLDKAAILDALLRKDLPNQVREVLYLRQAGSKSSVKKLQAMMNMVEEDGRIRGNLLYHAASTGRFAGKGVQLHNLPRPAIKKPELAIPYIQREAYEEIELGFGPVQNIVSDCIRSMVVAGPDKLLYAADFAAIEARVLAWIAGQLDLIEQFRSGEDVYLSFASEVYGKPLNKKEHDKERQLGKACIAKGTLVYTDHGLVPIEQITVSMKVWDGKEWVNHQGVLSKGIKNTLMMFGVSLTPDHLVLCGENWEPASSLAQNASMASLALATAAANSPSLDISLAHGVDSIHSLFAAIAASTNTVSTKILSASLRVHGVAYVPTRKARLLGRVIGDTATFVQMMPTENAFSIALPRSFNGVATPKTKTFATMAGAGSTFMNPGSKTEPHFYSTFSPSTHGMCQNSNLTELTTTKDIFPEISVLSLDKTMLTTEDKSEKCSRELQNLKPVYDIMNAGPRNRFTIHTECGPLIVHNCILGLGFMMGAAKFQLSCEKVGIFLEEGEYERIVKLYRKKYAKIYAFWYGFERAIIRAIKNPTQVYRYRMFRLCMRDGNLRVQLPSGRVLNYVGARVVPNKTPWGEVREAVEVWAENPKTRKWERSIVSPGTFTENVVQAIARDLMVAAMFRVEAHGYPVVLTVHDELVSEVDSGYGSVQEYEQLVAATPSWAEGLPVKAEGWRGPRYRK